ncbi:uncharacterized protein narya [Linepithema humile]|uniref:uncharacterized protein narya n=1 Tax=Linepithema humile TaxID=83485 RepID=UPI0006234191|nr:PREDICTED: uncharacterized protein LOC105670606 [Linepithema humile]
METLICNKCFIPIFRGKQPHYITQCGHISCQSCLQQVEKQCPQCEFVGPITIPLKEPLMPKVAPFFMSFTESLETLLKVDMFRKNQMKITMQRFREVDKKYEALKTHFFMERRRLKMLNDKLKMLSDKYMNLKAEKEKLSKKLSEMDNQRATFYAKTPADSAIFTHSSSSKYSTESLDFLKSIDMTPVNLVEPRKEYKTIDGFRDFRVPNNRKPPTSVNSRLSMNTSSICSFMK